jgi:hypothetical protein
MKRQNDRSITGRPFCEDRHPPPRTELLGRRLEDLMNSMTPATFDEQGARAVAQKADQWPTPDLGFCDEGARRDGVDHEDVEPTDVIGKNQSG